MRSPNGVEKVGNEVTFRWQVLGDKGRIEVYWRSSLIVKEVIHPSRPRIPFELFAEHDEREELISGDLVFFPGPVLSVENLFIRRVPYPDCCFWPRRAVPCDVVEPCEPCAEPITEPAPLPEPGESIVPAANQDLFPYLFLRPWPGVPAAEFDRRFVPYHGPCADKPRPTASRLYCRLRAIVEPPTTAGGRKKKGALREELENAAVKFVEGDSPYEGEAIGALSDLPEPLRRFPDLDAEVRFHPDLTLSRLWKKVRHKLHLKSFQDLGKLVRSKKFKHEHSRVWQNVFALTILLGYDYRLLDQLLRVLIVAHWLTAFSEVPVLTQTGGPGEEEEGTDESGDSDESDDSDPGESSIFDDELKGWLPWEIQQRARATILLPTPVFPLPPGPAVDGKKPLPLRPARVFPYAIGELQIVRQRLVGYRLGEISRIVNVLGGETRETAQRRLHRSQVSETRTSHDRRSSDFEESGVELLAAVQDILKQQSFVGYQTQYGPPTSAQGSGPPTAQGFWFLAGPESSGTSPKGQAKTQQEAAHFARQVTTRAARKVASEVAVLRSASTLDETEETTTSRLEAPAGQSLLGVYRWVDKVYRARTVRYGERLILEIFVPRPARNFVAGQLEVRGLQLTEPPTLAALGVASFTSISTDPDSPLFYGALASRYQASDLTPPPAERQTVSASFQPGAAVTTREVVVPEGYGAERAFAEIQFGGSQADTITVRGLVGRKSFELSGSQLGSPALSLSHETGTVPLAVVYESEGSPPWKGLVSAADPSEPSDTGDPADEPPPTPPDAVFVINVEVECRLQDRVLDEWRLATYRSLLEASRKARAEYFQVSSGASDDEPRRDPAADRQIIRRQLRRDVVALLRHQAAALVREPEEARLGRPRVQQFLEQAFEWDEMYYSFTDDFIEEDGRKRHVEVPGNDLTTPFTAFLNAESARILLPVNPARNYAVVFFLQSGLIWSGADELAPAFAASEEMQALVNDLKEVSFASREATSEPWEVTVPTQMTVLQESSELPLVAEDCVAEDRVEVEFRDPTGAAD